MRLRDVLFVGVVLVSVIVASTAQSTVPATMNYQGILTDASGDPISGLTSVVFRVYDQANGGTPLYTEVELVNPDAAGRINVTLGESSIVPLSSFFDGPNRWLGITVGADPELSPRTHLTSVAYSFRVGTVDGAAGGDLSGDLSVGGTVFVNGTNGVDGVEFPDGTRQTTAASASGVTYTPANTFRYTQLVTTTTTLTDFVPAVSGPYEARYITGIWLSGSERDITATCKIGSTPIVFLDDRNLSAPGSQQFWMCGGGAPIVLTGSETMTVEMAVPVTGSCVLTVTGYDQ